MHTTDKGEIARYLTIVHLMHKGAKVSIPTTENCAYDLIADINNKLFRVQVKKATIDNNLIKINLFNANHNKNKQGTMKKYTLNDIDWLIGVDIENKKFYLLDYSTGLFDNRVSIWLRTGVPDKEDKRIVWANRYEF